MNLEDREQERLVLQARLDAGKTQAERNRSGQFSTPTNLARDILQFGVGLLQKEIPIRFLDPGIGTGSFFSALLHTVPVERIEAAKGYELDPHYGEPSRELWRGSRLDLELSNFTTANPPAEETERYNLVICNPPYVRHHHIINGEKKWLQDATETACGVRIGGLAGLYCYFLGLSHPWMQSGAIAGWLIPSEFMDVNYGEAVKRYLLDKVTLLRIHRFDPNDVQFEDALVSSAVVWFRNTPPTADHSVEFTFGGSLLTATISRMVATSVLCKESKWTRFPLLDARTETTGYRLSDFFTIKRGLATGDNKFFILTSETIEKRGLPWEVFHPILPSPRYIADDEVKADEEGVPLLDRKLFLLDCRLSEEQIKTKYPSLHAYLEEGREAVATRYLCRSRKAWYFQEERTPAPIVCTYLGRADTKKMRPFRFILNLSRATAANVYLLLYPKPLLAQAMVRDTTLLRSIWKVLNAIGQDRLLGEGRVYGGGLHKLEPKELANVDATAIAELIPDLRPPVSTKQLDIFGDVHSRKSPANKTPQRMLQTSRR